MVDFQYYEFRETYNYKIDACMLVQWRAWTRYPKSSEIYLLIGIWNVFLPGTVLSLQVVVLGKR